LANARIIVKRRKSVRNIRKITRTMQLIATARFQAAYSRAMATKPYAERLAELVADLSNAVGEETTHPLMLAQGNAKRSAVVVLTSSRGLCGGYNTGVLRAAIGHLDNEAAKGVENEVSMVGKKGIGYFRFLRRPMLEQITHIGDAPRFEQVEPMANALMGRFLQGEICSAFVVYMRFYSAGRQKPAVMQLLPLTNEAGVKQTDGRESTVQYEFSPIAKELLAELLPATVRVQLFQCFIDATVSEQIGRMVAMKAATEAAAEMITSLTRRYNRARQSAITMELLDIVGGANALA